MVLETFKKFDPKQYSNDVVYSVNYLRDLDIEKAFGKYQLQQNIWLIVEEYQIKDQALHNSQFEVHNYTIDIQYPLKGYEKTYYVSHESLINPTEYDKQNDRRLYKSKKQFASEIITGNGSFGIYYPRDPHSPQKAKDGNEQVIKKATIKIKTDVL